LKIEIPYALVFRPWEAVYNRDKINQMYDSFVYHYENIKNGDYDDK